MHPGGGGSRESQPPWLQLPSYSGVREMWDRVAFCSGKACACLRAKKISLMVAAANGVDLSKDEQTISCRSILGWEIILWDHGRIFQA